MDRIWALPDPVIQHTLSFLPTMDVVRSCLISKRWSRIWHSVPTLCFSDNNVVYETPQGQNEFYKYVDNCLKHRKMRMCSIADSVITSFKLEMDYCRRSGARLDNWLDFAVESKVKVLNLLLLPEREETQGHDAYYYGLPETVVNSRYLNILELRCVELNPQYSFSLPSLKILTLDGIEVNDCGGDLVDVILLGCPSLEKLLLRDCWRMWNAQIHSLSLKFLEVDERGLSFDTELMEVEAINLESFALFSDCYSINISA